MFHQAHQLYPIGNIHFYASPDNYIAPGAGSKHKECTTSIPPETFLKFDGNVIFIKHKSTFRVSVNKENNHGTE